MGLCSRCHLSKTVQPCVLGGRKPCVLCQEDMELERKIQELQERQCVLRRQMNALHDPFVLALPPEITSNIFLLSLEKWDHEPYNPADYSTTISRKLPTPFLLGSVCKGWRQLARSTPQLWTTFSLTLAKPTNIVLLQAVNDWLQLSRSLPLDIFIFYRPDLPQDSQEICVPVIDTVNQHSRRWHTVVLRDIAPSYLNKFCGISPPSSLYHLEVINSDRAISRPEFKMNSEASPTTLTINGICLSAKSIGWNNLVTLVIEESTVEECMQVIRQAPLLDDCALMHFKSSTRSIPKTIFRHTHLRRLGFLFVPEEPFINFIDALECPSLEVFQCYSVINEMIVDSMVSFFRRSGSHLKHVMLHGLSDLEFNVEDFDQLSDAVPCLEQLDLHWDEGEGLATVDYLFEQLSSPASHLGGIPEFLPHLQSLTLHLDELDFRAPAGEGRLIPHIYHCPHRKHLSLELHLDKVQIDDPVSTEISNLIDEGAQIRILKKGKDYFQKLG